MLVLRLTHSNIPLYYSQYSGCDLPESGITIAKWPANSKRVFQPNERRLHRPNHVLRVDVFDRQWNYVHGPVDSMFLHVFQRPEAQLDDALLKWEKCVIEP